MFLPHLLRGMARVSVWNPGGSSRSSFSICLARIFSSERGAEAGTSYLGFGDLAECMNHLLGPQKHSGQKSEKHASVDHAA
jgi:hypothetical protein